MKNKDYKKAGKEYLYKRKLVGTKVHNRYVLNLLYYIVYL